MANLLRLYSIGSRHLFVNVLVTSICLSFMSYANAVDGNAICDMRAGENGIPYSIDITLAARDGSSLLIKQTCPLGKSYLEVNVIDQSTNMSLQTFQVEEENANLFPTKTQDVNLDGYPDLMFPVYTGNVNSWHSIWFYDPSQRLFQKVLEEGFVDFFKDKRGYFVASGRASCCAWEYHFYLLSKWILEPQFAILVEAPDEQIKRSRCKIWALDESTKKNDEPRLDKYLRRNYCTHYETRSSME
ncbi:MAG: hypothetical protein Q7U91_07555 [Sideroxyarcus sp.]|nr:hypothetical protein [Sideroxyarcus sp.]